MELNVIYNENCLTGLRKLSDNSVDCCVTSPPYYGLRDYGVEGQIGLEDTPDGYVAKLVEVFREVRRVLKDEGTLWLNLGDSYCGKNVFSGCKNKDLIGIPFMVAFALRADGWYLRNDIVWCLSGGTYLYVKSQKGVQPMMIKDMIRLNPQTIQLWNGKKWVNVLGWAKSNDTSKKIQIELRSGERIQCTGGHKWVLEDGTEKKASELKIGDILMSKKFNDEGSHNPSMFTADLLWLMGLWIAEGSLSDDCIQLSLNSSKTDWIERIRRAVTHVGGTITYNISKDKNVLNIRIYSQVFLAILHQYIGGKTAKNKHLNNICWQMSNDNLKHLITGYFDGDGYYDNDNNRIRLGFTRNYEWERDLRLLANRLDATLTLKLSTADFDGKKFPSFKGEWRWKTSNHLNNKNRCEIISIKNGVGRNYYDISVDCENHLFALASGVMTHNCKPNSMPEPVKDRCVRSHEYIFLMSKSERYYYDYKAVQEPATTVDDLQRRVANGNEVWKNNLARTTYALKGVGRDRREMYSKNENGEYVRNKKDVWTVNVKPDNFAHFAVFPEELIMPCILAGCPRDGVVLDPFMGSGTTARVATKTNRNYVGFELNPEYIKISEVKRRVTPEFLY